MTQADGSERISISRDTLRAELSGLELRIVDRITTAVQLKADQTEVDSLSHRIAALELSRAERAHMANDVSDIATRISRLERFRYGVPSAAVVSLAVTVGLLLTHHI